MIIRGMLQCHSHYYCCVPVMSTIILGMYTCLFLKLVSYASVNKWCRQAGSPKKQRIRRTKSVSMSEGGGLSLFCDKYCCCDLESIFCLLIQICLNLIYQRLILDFKFKTLKRNYFSLISVCIPDQILLNNHI